MATTTTTSTSSKPGPASAAAKGATEYFETMRTQFTTAVKQSQQLMLDTLSSFTDVASKIAPSLPALPSLPSVPFVPTSAEVTEYVAAGFDIAAELLASQRDFTTALIAKLAAPVA
jgi:hypothetical protein